MFSVRKRKKLEEHARTFCSTTCLQDSISSQLTVIGAKHMRIIANTVIRISMVSDLLSHKVIMQYSEHNIQYRSNQMKPVYKATKHRYQ